MLAGFYVSLLTGVVEAFVHSEMGFYGYASLVVDDFQGSQQDL